MFSRAKLAVVLPCLFALVLSPARGQTSHRVTSFSFSNAQIESTSVDVSTFPNRAILEKGQNFNIAKGRSVSLRYASNDPSKISTLPQSSPRNLTDGIIASSNFLQLLPGQEGTRIMIDLGAVRLVNRVQTYTHIKSAFNNRIRAYSIYTSMDSLIFRRAKQVADNQDTYTVDIFTPDTARYVAIIVETQDRLFETIISEVDVYSLGYLTGGMFTSKAVDLSTDVNVGQVRWWADIPTGTEIRFQVRTGNSGVINEQWSPWSAELLRPDGVPTVIEPRRFMQYRAILYTQLLDTPRLDSCEIDYDTMYVAASADASVNPTTVEILKTTRISYDINLIMDSRSRGVDTVLIYPPLPVVVSDASFNGAPVSFTTSATTSRTAVTFPGRITGTGKLTIGLKLTPVLNVNRFPSAIISNTSPLNPQSVGTTKTAKGDAWELYTTGIPDQIISTAIADPNPFTPNGDQINDVTQFSFFLTNLLEPRPVRLKIYDVAGRLVRTLLDGRSAARGFVEGDAIPWDGTDDRGRRLPPGLYVYQIIVETDDLDPPVLTKTVTIAY